jgi:hypothetical protein
MRPTTAPESNVFDINYLLHPGTTFDHPRDVVAHSDLSLGKSALSSHPGLPMPLPSPRARRYARWKVSNIPLRLTRSLTPFGHSMMGRASRRVANPCASARSHGRLPHKRVRSRRAPNSGGDANAAGSEHMRVVPARRPVWSDHRDVAGGSSNVPFRPPANRYPLERTARRRFDRRIGCFDE